MMATPISRKTRHAQVNTRSEIVINKSRWETCFSRVDNLPKGVQDKLGTADFAMLNKLSDVRLTLKLMELCPNLSNKVLLIDSLVHSIKAPLSEVKEVYFYVIQVPNPYLGVHQLPIVSLPSTFQNKPFNLPFIDKFCSKGSFKKAGSRAYVLNFHKTLLVPANLADENTFFPGLTLSNVDETLILGDASFNSQLQFSFVTEHSLMLISEQLFGKMLQAIRDESGGDNSALVTELEKQSVAVNVDEITMNRVIKNSVHRQLQESGLDFEVYSQAKLQDKPLCIFGTSLVDMAIFHRTQFCNNATVHAVHMVVCDSEDPDAAGEKNEEKYEVTGLVHESGSNIPSKKKYQLIAGMVLLASTLTHRALCMNKFVKGCHIYGILLNKKNPIPGQSVCPISVSVYKLSIDFEKQDYTLIWSDSRRTLGDIFTRVMGAIYIDHSNAEGIDLSQLNL